MRDYLITIATATLAAMLLQVGSPPACAATTAVVQGAGSQ